jgi:L-threonylcarbamoyladenylate synthase
LRPGFVTAEDLRKYVPVRTLARPGLNGVSPSPGIKHRHYQPNCRIVLVSSGLWREKLREILKENMKLGVLALVSGIPINSRIVFSRNFAGNTRLMARELYPSFLAAERMGVDVLVVEEPQKTGLGTALLDRLRRAAK